MSDFQVGDAWHDLQKPFGADSRACKARHLGTFLQRQEARGGDRADIGGGVPLRSRELSAAFADPESLAWIMHYAAVFCTSGELTRADIPSGEIGARQLVMQRVRG